MHTESPGGRRFCVSSSLCRIFDRVSSVYLRCIFRPSRYTEECIFSHDTYLPPGNLPKGGGVRVLVASAWQQRVHQTRGPNIPRRGTRVLCSREDGQQQERRAEPLQRSRQQEGGAVAVPVGQHSTCRGRGGPRNLDQVAADARPASPLPTGHVTDVSWTCRGHVSPAERALPRRHRVHEQSGREGGGAVGQPAAQQEESHREREPEGRRVARTARGRGAGCS
mmetsp:Transcript_37848/g.125430  ORF Transcript_37848/g.125430 Transcript_37848/m.125430 type:complete len:223 (-) Transcript_37848:630-1298(-)